MKKFKFAICLSILFFSWFLCAETAAPDANRVYIDVGQAKLKKSLLALTPLLDLTTKSGVVSVRTGQEIFEVLKNDLTFSGYFTLQHPDSFTEDPRKVGLKPAPGTSGGFNFSNWSAIGTEFLIRAGFQVVGEKIRLQTYLYYVPQANLVLGREYEGDKSALRKLAHRYANDIVEALTKKKGMFLTKVVATRDSGKGIKDIFMMDWDGASPKQLTKFETISQSPSWSYDGKKIAFTSFAFHPNWKSRNADLFIYELATGKTFLVSSKRGTNSGAAFTPDGKDIFFSLTQTSSPTNIHRFNLQSEKTTQITQGLGQSLNVEPAVSPDGKRLVFSSDRSGRPMIYTSDLSGNGANRITFAGWYNSAPVWSPDGKKIAFAGQDREQGGHFDIFMMDNDGQNLVRLTSAKKKTGKWADNEDPSFSPDGRFVMFTSNRTMHRQIYVVDLSSLEEREITHDDHEYERPKWSPFYDLEPQTVKTPEPQSVGV